MEDPRPELKADTDEHRDEPDFDSLVAPEDLVSEDRTRDNFFDTVLGLSSPATAREVADRAEHGVDAAREYLEWFDRIGIVTQVTDSPATYERNQEYLQWRRVQQLRNRYEDDELLRFLEDEVERDDSFAEKFDTESPEAVAIAAHATDTDRSVEAVWEDVSAWKTTRRRISLHERALRTSPRNSDP
ncbi:DUF7342 family protein [Halospeciosus flavus]|uniref:Sugar-specific transcriptional regulator TrmB n=1 Tax=Halospeciosus flavus TaxID=3032283 RepID=A0ABD5Z395_9EURY|nr:hypothetical protein [Halospeciosus flavus]